MKKILIMGILILLLAGCTKRVNPLEEYEFIEEVSDGVFVAVDYDEEVWLDPVVSLRDDKWHFDMNCTYIGEEKDIGAFSAIIEVTARVYPLSLDGDAWDCTIQQRERTE